MKTTPLIALLATLIGCTATTPSPTNPTGQPTTIAFGDVVAAYDAAEVVWAVGGPFLPAQDQTAGNAVFSVGDPVLAKIQADIAASKTPVDDASLIQFVAKIGR